MRRTTTTALSAAAIAGALTFGTAYATQACTDSGDDASAASGTPTAATAPVLNKNGHEVSVHAAQGQARAAVARAQHLAKLDKELAKQHDKPEVKPEVKDADESTDPTATHDCPGHDADRHGDRADKARHWGHHGWDHHGWDHHGWGHHTGHQHGDK